MCGTKRRYRRQASRDAIWRQSTLTSDYTKRITAHVDQTNEFIVPRSTSIGGPGQYWGVHPQYSIRSAPTYTGLDRSTTFTVNDIWQSPLSEDIDQQSESIMTSLQRYLTQPPGIKMIAHGTKCNPRPVYITLHFTDDLQYLPLEYQNCLTWRAELRSKDNATTPLKLGNLRTVAFQNILGVHRGKVTTALRRVHTAGTVDSAMCFSLLTKSGTLDLQCCKIDDGIFMSGQNVRDCFIDLLGTALRTRGVTFNNGSILSPGEGSSRSSNNLSSKLSPTAESTVSPFAEKSIQNSTRENDAGGNTSGPPSQLSGDANLSVISF